MPGLVSNEAWPQRVAARLVGSKVFWTLFVLIGFTLPIVRSILKPLPVPPPTLGAFPSFSLVDESGRPLTNATLAGRLVIVEFSSADRVLAGSPLARLQTRVRNTGNAVHLVTFVRGGADTASLASLARAAHAGTWRWSFASATDALEAAAAKVARVPSLDDRLVLLDLGGQVRRVAHAGAKDEVDQMMRDIGLLANLSQEKASR
jgi:hypothetical protein